MDDYEKWLNQRIAGLMRMARGYAGKDRFDSAAEFDLKRRTLVEARDAYTRFRDGKDGKA